MDLIYADSTRKDIGVMMAYTLFTIIAVGSAVALLSSSQARQRLADMMLLLLYPATFLLSLGILVGSVWANESWGTYWGWDPKEVWALITLLVYAVPLHGAVIPPMRNPRVFHAYLVCAFATVLMTYFGVNYLLGGMHSYA